MRVAWLILLGGCGFESPGAALGAEGGATAPDAGFDVATCPATYNAPLPGPSRYRLIPEGGIAPTQSDACNRDLPNATHLVVLETLAEVMNVSGFLDGLTPAPMGNAVWVGGVQQRNSPTPTANWLGFNDDPLISAWKPGEPNDTNVEDNGEQFVFIERNQRYLADKPGNTNSGALCECDGKPVGPMAAKAIMDNR